MMRATFPEKGVASDALFAEMEAARAHDVDWKRGRVGLYVHYAGEDVLAVAKEAYQRFFSENALGPKAFPSLKKFEDDVVDWALDLLHAPPDGDGRHDLRRHREHLPGRSHTARDWARATRPAITEPEIVAALERASRVRQGGALPRHAREAACPLRDDFRADVDGDGGGDHARTRSCRYGSAPTYPHGVIDPIAALAALARERGLWLPRRRVRGRLPRRRSCASSATRCRRSISRSDGVTSISADLHKYGFAAKGASVLLLADDAMRKHLEFDFDNWPRGLYSRPRSAARAPAAPSRRRGR